MAGKEPFPKQRAGARPARVISTPAMEGSAGLPSPDYKALTDGGERGEKIKPTSSVGRLLSEQTILLS